MPLKPPGTKSCAAQAVLDALIWGLLAASALPLGAAAGVFFTLPQRAIAAAMAFGSGALIAATSTVLMQEAYERGGLLAAACGFIAGAIAFTAANAGLRVLGGKHRKRSGSSQAESRALGIAAGSMLDNVPEMLMLGMGAAGGVNPALLAGIFVSNFPEGLASAAGLRRAGRSRAFALFMWGVIGLAAALAALAGFALLGSIPAEWLGVANGVAGGAILAMVVDTMIPEAYETAHDASGLITAAGFMLAYVLQPPGS